MAEQKLHMSVLRQAIVDRTGATEKEAGLFLKALVEQIVEGLKAGEQIKINGLGTFRLQEMAPRKSVNVNTGEAMIIPGYKKVVFMPEVSMREMVEKNGTIVALSGLNERPSAPIADDESLSPLEKLGRQADEIVDLLADLGQGPKAVVPAVEEKETVGEKENEQEAVPIEAATEEQEEVTETPAAEEEIAEEDVKEEDVAEKEEDAEENEENSTKEEEETERKEGDTEREEEELKEEETPEETKEEKNIAAEEVQEANGDEKPQEEQEAHQEKQEKKKSKYHFLRDTLICVVCLLAVLLGGFFCMRNALSNWIDTLVTDRNQPAADTVVVQEVKTPVAVEEKTAEPAVPTKQETRAERPVYKSYIATEEIREGSRLTWLAYRYYGDKALWVYIYDANKDHLGNPNNIKVGTPIRIPALTAAQRDTTLTSTRETMKMLLDEAVNWDK